MARRTRVGALSMASTILITLPPDAVLLPVGTLVEIVLPDQTAWPAEVRAWGQTADGYPQVQVVFCAKGGLHDHARAPQA